MAERAELEPVFKYGYDTRFIRYSAVKDGFLCTMVMPLPPRKIGEPITELEECAIKEATKQGNIARQQWLAKLKEDDEYARIKRGKDIHALVKADLEKRKKREEEKRVLLRNTAKQANMAKNDDKKKTIKTRNFSRAKQTNRRQKIINARNVPWRAFPLLKNHLKKMKNASGSGKLARG